MSVSRSSILLDVRSSPTSPQTTSPTLTHSSTSFPRPGRSGNGILKYILANLHLLNSSRWSIHRKSISAKTPTITKDVYTEERKSSEARMASRWAKMQSNIESSIRVRKIQVYVVLSLYAAGVLYGVILLIRGKL